MKYVSNLFPRIILFFTILFLTTSCAAVGEIFKVGMSVGIFFAVVIIGLVIFIISRFGKSKQ